MVKRRNLPDKILLVHQFEDGMIERRGRLGQRGAAPPSHEQTREQRPGARRDAERRTPRRLPESPAQHRPGDDQHSRKDQRRAPESDEERLDQHPHPRGTQASQNVFDRRGIQSAATLAPVPGQSTNDNHNDKRGSP